MSIEFMSIELILMFCAVFLGAATQAGVGIGFSIIAGPFLLIVLDTEFAITLLLLLNSVVSVIATDLKQLRLHNRLILHAIVACALGLAGGLLTFPLLSNAAILAIAASIILFGVLSTFLTFKIKQAGFFSIFVLAGLATVWAATPGPIMIVALIAQGLPGTETRKLVQPIALFAYGAALLLHALDGWDLGESTGYFVAIAVAGSIAGRLIGPSLSHKVIIHTVRAISIIASIALFRRALLLT